MDLTQGLSAAVNESVGASLLGCEAPFWLMQNHSCSGRLEASTPALRKWLFSERFERYLSLLQVCARIPCLVFCCHLAARSEDVHWVGLCSIPAAQGADCTPCRAALDLMLSVGMYNASLNTSLLSLLLQAMPESTAEASMSTAACLAHETAQKEHAMKLWHHIIKHEASHVILLKAGPCNGLTVLVNRLMVMIRMFGALGNTRCARGLTHEVTCGGCRLASLQVLHSNPGGNLLHFLSEGSRGICGGGGGDGGGGGGGV